MIRFKPHPCPSCGTVYERDHYLRLPSRDWPEMGLRMRLCPCGHLMSTVIAGTRGDGDESHALIAVGSQGGRSTRRAESRCDLPRQHWIIIAEGAGVTCAACRKAAGLPPLATLAT
jgi:hypothetical protein